MQIHIYWALAFTVTAALLSFFGVKLMDRLRRRDAETEAREIVSRADRESANRRKEAELEIKEMAIQQKAEGERELGKLRLNPLIAAEAVADLNLLLQLNSDLVPQAGVFPTVGANFLLDWGIGDRTAPPLTFGGSAVTRTDDGSFLTDGFKAGQQITIAGSQENNGAYTIQGVAEKSLTLDRALTDESADAGQVTIFLPIDKSTTNAVKAC